MRRTTMRKVKKWTWEDLWKMQDLINFGWHGEANSIMREYLDVGVLALATAKWHPDNPDQGLGRCAACDAYHGCMACPLDGEDGCCNGLFDLWSMTRGGHEREVANKIFEFIHAKYKRLYEEYERCLNQ
jgi:hypothetical protein